MSTKNNLLMPKGVAMWLIKNTKLTFEQIAHFCNLHDIEIQHLADDESILPVNPILTSELTKAEVLRCEQDSKAKLRMQTFDKTYQKKVKYRKYIPIIHRKNKANAILWLIKHHPTVEDKHIKKLIGTTKETIDKIKNKTHKNYTSLVPKHPVDANLCSLDDFNKLVNAR